MDVHVIVLSEAPKDLGPDVDVIVGLPSKDPWSLPFAHKPVFAANADAYDLFIYTEDDMGVTESNIKAFISATPHMAQDEVVGFLRYENDAPDSLHLPEVHTIFHWNPSSVRLRGPYTIAEFSNEHAGFFILTQAQLKQAIASGGFMKQPYRGRYGMPESAATDPYTSCGFHKVICISALDDFLIHHQSNRYIGNLGLPLNLFRRQLDALIAIIQGTLPAVGLIETETKLDPKVLSKFFYEPSDDHVVNLLPTGVRHVLSIGCGWGDLEATLIKKGIKVTALPLDAVIGSMAGQLGIEMVYGTFEEGMKKLGTRRFDSVIMTNLLHLLPDALSTLENCASFVSRNGSMILSGPNFSSYKVRVKQLYRIKNYAMLSNYSASGVSPLRPEDLDSPLRNGGLQLDAVRWIGPKNSSNGNSGSRISWTQKLTATHWIARASR